MGGLLHHPGRFLGNMTPGLPSYIGLREAKIAGNHIAADFSSSYYLSRLKELLSLHTEILGDNVFSGIEIDLEGGTPANRSRLKVRQQLQRHNLVGANIIVAFINLNSGTGKRTPAVTFAHRSCLHGRRACVVDIDPQASASFMLAS